MLLTIFIFVILFCDTHSLHFEGDLQCRDFTAYCTCTCTTFVPCWQPLDRIDRVRGYRVELALSIHPGWLMVYQAGGFRLHMLWIYFHIKRYRFLIIIYSDSSRNIAETSYAI